MEISAAGVLIIDNQGKILVLHRKGNVPEGNTWGMAGGRIKQGQEPKYAAITKTFQETGQQFKAQDLSLLKIFKYPIKNDNIIFFVYTTKLKDSEPKIILNTDGHNKYMWEYPKKLLNKKDLIIGMYPILKEYIKKFI